MPGLAPLPALVPDASAVPELDCPTQILSGRGSARHRSPSQGDGDARSHVQRVGVPAIEEDRQNHPVEDTPLLNASAKGVKLRAVDFGLGLDNLVTHFGYKLLVMLFVSQHLMKGFASAFTGPCVQYLYGSYNVPASRMQIYSGVTALPWAMKPVIGLLSDALPIFGFNKAPYMLMATMGGLVALASIGTVPQASLSVTALVMCLFMLALQFSTCDLLTEAKYAEKMQERPQQGPALMTFVWFGLTAGGLLATALIGPVMTVFGYKAPFLMAILPNSLIVMPLILNYMEEKRKTPEEQRQARAVLAQQPEACFLCILMFAGTVLLTFLGINYQQPWINATASIAVAIVMLLAFSLLLRPIIAKVNAFFLIQTSLSVSISGASFYFYTDSHDMYPEGPNFSMQFYISVLGIVGSVCSLVGIWSYQRYASEWTYRGLLLTTNIVASSLSLLDVLFFTRWNTRVGIPDHYFVLGSSVLTSMVMQWQWMPGIVILSQLCPKGMEATMYALLAGCHNLGASIASSCGAMVLFWLKCEPTGAKNETDQFRNLWMASALSTILPALTLLLLPLLIPNAKQTDKLLQDDDRDATTGSWWRHFMGTDREPVSAVATA